MEALLLFDRSKPFYPFIMAFYSSLHGYLDLISRYAVDEVARIDTLGAPSLDVIRSLDPIKFVSASKTPYLLSNTLSLDAQVGKDVEINWDELAQELYVNANYVLSTAIESALRMLMLSCYEVAKFAYNDLDEVWRFFKHCRNAAAHNGKFDLRTYDDGPVITPGKPARWVSKEIFMYMNGDPLLIDQGGKAAFLKLGDVLRLIHDIETKIQIIRS